jgi:hypothetical protein
MARIAPRLGSTTSLVLQSMNATERQENRLVLSEKDLVVIACDKGRTVNDHPMLGPVEVLLEGQLGSRKNRDALDLEALPDVKRLVLPPGPADLLCLRGGAAAACPQRVHHLLDVLIGRLAGHKNRIRRCDHYKVLNSDGCHELAFARTWQFDVRSITASPSTTFPASSLSASSRRADHAPTSDQGKAIGTTAARPVRSMTA